MDKTRISKKRCLRMETLHQDVVSRILERLPVKSLLRFKTVSKQWKSTIESRFFQRRHLMHRQQSGDPDIAMVSIVTPPRDIESLRTLVLGSSSSVKIPTFWEKEKTEKKNIPYLVCYNSCDGLLCLYHFIESGFVVNPTTRWYRPLPHCEYHQHVFKGGYEVFKLGFGKDIFTDTYKPVWLYNSSEIGLENATTCQVFDFSTNAWRYVTPAAPYRVVDFVDPVFVDGSLHWFTDCEETKVISFDLHTESFQVISKAPFVNSDSTKIVMCNLDNCLCVSEMKLPDQVIWSFNQNNKTWNKIYSIYLDMTYLWHGIPNPKFNYVLQPLAVLDWGKKKKKKKLLYYDRLISRELFTHDPESVLDDVVFSAESIGFPVCYFQSLISIL